MKPHCTCALPTIRPLCRSCLVCGACELPVNLENIFSTWRADRRALVQKVIEARNNNRHATEDARRIHGEAYLLNLFRMEPLDFSAHVTLPRQPCDCLRVERAFFCPLRIGNDIIHVPVDA